MDSHFSTRFTRFSVVLAFLGFFSFLVFGTAALVSYPPGWNIFNDSFSTAGSVISGNLGTIFMLVGLSTCGILMIPITLLYIRAYLQQETNPKTVLIIICFLLQVVSRVFMVLVGVFPTEPYGDLHDAFAMAWFLGEALATIMLSIVMVSSKRNMESKDKKIGLLYIIFNFLAFFIWLPYILGIWEGMAIPEVYSVFVIYSFSMILWKRAYKRKYSIAKQYEKSK